MSDFFPGTGWWLASDGKWYEPSSHPDATYRASFANTELEAPEPTAEQVEVEEVELEEVDDVEDVIEASQTEAPQPDIAPASTARSSADVREREKISAGAARSGGWVSDPPADAPAKGFAVPPHEDVAHELSLEERADAIQAREMEERRLRLERARRSAEALRDETRFVPIEEDELLPDDDDVAPERDDTEPDHTEPDDPESDDLVEAVSSPQVAGRTKLEIDGSAARRGATPPLRIADFPVKTTALVHVPTADEPRVDPIDRLLAVILFLGGIAMVLGAFMAWTTGPAVETGLERPDGVIVVIAGAVAAAAAGPMFAGLWVSWARGTAITAGVIGLMAVGVVIVTTLTEMELTGRSLASGVYVVGAGTLVAIVAGLASRSTTH